MAFQEVPDVAAFTAKFTGPDGTRPSFTLMCRDQADVWDAGSLGVIAEALADAIEADYLPALPTDTTFVGVTSRRLDQEFGLVIDHTPRNAAGELASPSLPAEVAVRATFIGTPGAAPRRGGIYLLPPGESQVTGSLLTGGAATALQAAVEAMSAAMDTGAGEHVIVSRYSGTELRDRQRGTLVESVAVPVKRNQGVSNTVQAVVVRNRVDSQKKRRPSE